MGMLHPNEGEVLCFEYNNFDCKKMFSFDDTLVAFPFTNCAGHEIHINEITCNNKYGDQVFYPNKLWNDSIVPAGVTDTIYFRKKEFLRERDDLLDVSFTISFKDEQALQYLNIFVDFVPNYGSLEVSPIHLPTVERGDSIIFSALIKNSGASAVTLKSSSYNWGRHAHQKIRLIKGGKIVVPANGSLEVEFMLYTDNLLNEYDGSFSFESNEDQRKYHRLPLDFDGKLISEGYPSIKFDSLVLTKYLVQGGECLFDFWFENNGDDPLIIVQARTSCGCLVASWPKEPILAGERNVIRIKYDSKRLGPINKSCTVTSNAPEPITILRVKGHISLDE